MATKIDTTVTYRARIDWRHGDTITAWNLQLASVVEVFGLPGDRYRTHVDADWMDFEFFSEHDRLLFLTGWPSFIPDEA